MDPIIMYGNYSTQLKPYLEIFDLENIHFVDGGNIAKNPEIEYSKIEDFFDVPNRLKFSFNAEKGYPCLKSPVSMCLGSDKGLNIFRIPQFGIPQFCAQFCSFLPIFHQKNV